MTTITSGTATEILFVGNDMVCELRGLRNATTGAYANHALATPVTVTVTLKDVANSPVTGASWPLSMSYVTASNGVYRATLPDTLSIAENARYTATVIADAGAGLQARWDLPCFARLRT